MSTLQLGLAYSFLCLLLLLAVFKSEVHSVIKIGLVGVSLLFYIGHFNAMKAYRGWPAETAIPDQFELLSYRIIEPNHEKDRDGAIYIWVIERNQNSDIPRSIEIPYSKETHQELSKAGDRQRRGERQSGRRITASEDINGQSIKVESVLRQRSTK